MPWRMPRSKNHPNDAIAEQIKIVGKLAAKKLPVESRTIEVSSNIGALREPMRVEGIIVFGTLDDMLCLGKPADRAGMVEVQVRLENETNVLRLDPDRSTLIDAV